MDTPIKEIYEIQNIGKGVITNLTPENLLRIKDEYKVPGLQEVMDSDSRLDNVNFITVEKSLHFITPTGNGVTLDNDATAQIPAVSIGKSRGTSDREVSLGLYPDKAVFMDGQNNRGLEYQGNYEANFIDRSLVTKKYVDNSVVASTTKIANGLNTTVSGNGTVATPFAINVDGSATKIVNGTTTSTSGTGTIATPYKIETVNLQKSIISNYVLTAADNNYSIKVNNSTTPVIITIPTGLPENCFVGVTQKGTGDVTIVGTGTIISNPVGFKIKGTGYYVGIEQIGTTNSFDLLGNTKL